MKVIVFGATGKTGIHVCWQALEQGHKVTAFARSVGKVEGKGLRLQVAQGNVTDAESVAEASVAGHDAAIVALGSNGLRDRTTLRVGTPERGGGDDETRGGAAGSPVGGGGG